MSQTRYDVVQIKAQRTDDGYIHDSPILTRTGIFEYRDPITGKISREYRPAEEVFHKDSLDSYRGQPVTIGHPGKVNSTNVRQHFAGTLLSPGRQDADNVIGDLVIHDPAAVDAGHNELSLGYELHLDETPGEFNGQRYDAIQRNIRVNHCAIVKKGRAGNARLNLDSADIEEEKMPSPDDKLTTVRLDSGIEYRADREVQVALHELRDKAKAETTRADQAEAARDQAKSDLDAAKAETTRVRQDAVEQARSRLALEATAKQHGVDVRADSTDRGLREAVIRKLNANAADFAGKSDDYVSARFDAALEGAQTRNDSVTHQRREMTGSPDVRADMKINDPRAAYIQGLKKGVCGIEQKDAR